jgi:hypothetical protein
MGTGRAPMKVSRLIEGVTVRDNWSPPQRDNDLPYERRYKSFNPPSASLIAC